MSEAAYGLTGDFIFKEAVEFLKKRHRLLQRNTKH